MKLHMMHVRYYGYSMSMFELHSNFLIVTRNPMDGMQEIKCVDGYEIVLMFTLSYLALYNKVIKALSNV